MHKAQQSHIIAALGTLVFMTVVFLLLWFIYLGAPVVKEEKGIEVAFEQMELPQPEPKPEPKVVPLPPAQHKETPKPASSKAAAKPAKADPKPAKTQPKAQPKPSATSSNREMTQRDESAVKAKREAEEKAKAEREAREKAEAKARAKAEKEAKAQAERDAKAAKARAAMAGVKGGTGTSGGKTGGSGSGAGQTGSSGAGRGSSNGANWALQGRDLRGSLPKPSNNFNQSGKVVVQIRVDAAGNVVSATVIGGNISDQATRNIALAAAKKAKFSPSSQSAQTGTITFKFVDN